MSSWLLLSLIAAPAATSSVTAEEAMATYRQTFTATQPARCATPERPDELVVCGRRDGEARLPLPLDRVPGEVDRLLPGEARMIAESCIPTDRCPGGVSIDVFRAIGVAKRIFDRVTGRDD